MANEFITLKAKGTDLAKCDHLSEAFATLLQTIDSIVGPSRERALVVTKLQEAFYWAERGVENK